MNKSLFLSAVAAVCVLFQAPVAAQTKVTRVAADMLEREGIDRSKVTLLDKPFGADRLIAAVKQELDHAASPGERRRR